MMVDGIEQYLEREGNRESLRERQRIQLGSKLLINSVAGDGYLIPSLADAGNRYLTNS